jgi:glutamine synthetase
VASIQEILDKAKKEKAIFVNLQFTDILGSLKEITLPIQRLGDVLKTGAWFDGSSIEGFARIHESDLYLKPDPDTYAVIPWLSSPEGETVRLICDIYGADGKPYEGDPRGILKRTLAKAKSLGFICNTGPELEFYVFKEVNGKPVPMDGNGYFDLPTDEMHVLLREITSHLEHFGIEVEASHHEVGPGQAEVDFKYGEALETADRLLTLRTIVKAMAQKRGLRATLMPKPMMGMAGNGMHVHQSLSDPKTGKNLFYDPSDKYELSKVAYQFIAGQLRHIKGMMAVLCPTVNSYKRLVSGFEAPVYISWARINRSALVRVPRWFAGKGNAARMELRCPDPACNPYLAFVLMLAAGLDGIQKNFRLGPAVEEDLYSYDAEKLAKHNIDTLPASLLEAMREFKDSFLVKETLGDHLFKQYLHIKQEEWKEFKAQVTPWELEKYFDM